ncbi:hypothetical protein ACFQX7_37120 [Luedemannella flava]
MTVYDIAAALPSIEVLRGRCRAIAVLERAMDGIQPYHCYTRAWGDDEAALMRDGCGDEWAVVFTGEGAFIRVFDHESAMSPYCDEDRELWPGLLDGLPPEFVAQVEEPAFGDEEGHFVATAVLWRLAGDDRWHAGQGIEFPPSRGPYDEGRTVPICWRSCSTTSLTSTSDMSRSSTRPRWIGTPPSMSWQAVRSLTR